LQHLQPPERHHLSFYTCGPKTALAGDPQPRHKLRSGAAAFWSQLVTKLGHTVKLTPPKYVTAYGKRGKTDAIDAGRSRRG
jgi:hypothetical protein